jgi:hypothetical protein
MASDADEVELVVFGVGEGDPAAWPVMVFTMVTPR